jgi:hypothetical protein
VNKKIVLVVIGIVSLIGISSFSQIYPSLGGFSKMMINPPIEINEKSVRVNVSIYEPGVYPLRIQFLSLSNVEFELDVSKKGKILSTTQYKTDEYGYIRIGDPPSLKEGGLYDIKISILSSSETGTVGTEKYVTYTKISVPQEKTFYINTNQNISSRIEWFDVEPTQCANQFDDEWYLWSKDKINDPNEIEQYSELRLEFFKLYFEKNGITILDSRYENRWENNPYCEECSCGGGFYTYMFLIYKTQLPLMEELNELKN